MSLGSRSLPWSSHTIVSDSFYTYELECNTIVAFVVNSDLSTMTLSLDAMYPTKPLLFKDLRKILEVKIKIYKGFFTCFQKCARAHHLKCRASRWHQYFLTKISRPGEWMDCHKNWIASSVHGSTHKRIHQIDISLTMLIFCKILSTHLLYLRLILVEKWR